MLGTRPPSPSVPRRNRLPPERLPVGLVDCVGIDGRLGLQADRQEAPTSHLAEVIAVGLEAGHVEPLALSQLLSAGLHGGQELLIIRILRVREHGRPAQFQSTSGLGQRRPQQQRLRRPIQIAERLPRMPFDGQRTFPVRSLMALDATTLQDRTRHGHCVHAAAQAGVRAGVGGTAVDPQSDEGALVVGELGLVVAAIDQLHQPAGGTANRARGPVAERLVPSVRHQMQVGDRPVTRREVHEVIARQIDVPVEAVRIVTCDAMPIEDGLDIARIVEGTGNASQRFDLRRAPAVGSQILQPRLRERVGALLVTADAARDLARLAGVEALHAFYGQVVLVQGHEEHRAEGRDFEIGRAILFHRDRAQNARQREAAAAADRFHAAIEVHRHRQLLQHQQFLDVAALHAVHVAALIDVGQHQLRRLLRLVDARRDHPLTRSGLQRSRLVTLQLSLGLGQLVEEFHVALPVHDVQTFATGDQEAIFGYRVGVAVDGGSATDLTRGAQVVRSRQRVDNRDVSGMFRHAVPGRERGDHLVRARNRLGIQHGDPAEAVAEVGHLARAIRIHRPQVMEVDLRAVDVFPTHIQDPAIGHGPRRVVVIVVAGQHADVRTVGFAAIQRRHAAVPAVDEPAAAAGAEHDPAIGHVGGFDIVVGPLGQLREPAAVELDLVQVIRRRLARTVREQNLPTVVVHLRIAHAAQWIVEQHLQFAGAQVQPAQSPAVAVTA